jgi:hypothetical protein
MNCIVLQSTLFFTNKINYVEKITGIRHRKKKPPTTNIIISDIKTPREQNLIFMGTDRHSFIFGKSLPKKHGL